MLSPYLISDIFSNVILETNLAYKVALWTNPYGTLLQTALTEIKSALVTLYS